MLGLYHQPTKVFQICISPFSYVVDLRPWSRSAYIAALELGLACARRRRRWKLESTSSSHSPQQWRCFVRLPQISLVKKILNL